MPRPITTYGDELKPVALYSSSGRALGPSTLVLVDALALRDTTLRQYLAELTGYARKMIAFLSTLNQDVTVTLGFSVDGTVLTGGTSFVGGLIVPASSARYLGPEGTTNAGFISEPRLGPGNYVDGIYVNITASVAPTSGTLSVHVMRHAF